MSIFDENPKVIFKNIKELLTIGAKDRKHAFHTPVFSTTDVNNLTNSRIVVLRKFNENTLTLNFHTDYRSKKVVDLKNNHHSNFVFYDSKIKTQLRIKTSTKINYSNKVTKETWELTRLFSRKCYLTQKPPSSVTTLPEDGIPGHLKGIDPNIDESEHGYKNFTVIENAVQEIDWLYLASSGHRRLKISFENSNPIYKWMIP